MLPTEQFSKTKLIQLISDNQIEQAKIYTKQYFYKTLDPIATFYYDYYSKSFLNKTQEDIKKSLLTKNMNTTRGHEKFSIQSWFYDENDDFYSVRCNPRKDSIYTGRNGQKFINVFSGFPHPRKPYKDYNKNTQKGVEYILEHIRIVICSRKEEQYIYHKHWIARMCCGYKNDTLLVWTDNDIKGVGKTSCIEFLRDNVLGNNLVYQSDRSDCLTDWNSMLVGKVLICLEEISSKTTGSYHCITKAIKHITTNKTIQIKEKYKKEVEYVNIANMIVCANNRPFRQPGRRIVASDISPEKKGDVKYFDQLYVYIEDPLVGEAFYNHMCEFHEQHGSKFRCSDIPMTDTSHEMIVDNLKSSMEFIKDEYLSHNKGLDISAHNLYTHYLYYCQEKKVYKKLSKIEFGKDMKKIGLFNKPKSFKKKIDGVIKATTERRYNNTYEEIYNNMDEQHMIHPDDELTVVENVNVSSLGGFLDKKEKEHDDMKKLVDKLNAQISKLKRKNKKLKRKVKSLEKAELDLQKDEELESEVDTTEPESEEIEISLQNNCILNDCCFAIKRLPIEEIEV